MSDHEPVPPGGKIGIERAMYPTPTRRGAEEFTTEELLRAIGNEVQGMTRATYIIAAVAILQAAMIAAWLFGLLTVEFKPLR